MFTLLIFITPDTVYCLIMSERDILELTYVKTGDLIHINCYMYRNDYKS